MTIIRAEHDLPTADRPADVATRMHGSEGLTALHGFPYSALCRAGHYNRAAAAAAIAGSEANVTVLLEWKPKEPVMCLPLSALEAE